MVIAHQRFGAVLRFNPHFHAIVLEGGFDTEDFAGNLLSWKHSGFSIDNSVRTLDESA